MKRACVGVLSIIEFNFST